MCSTAPHCQESPCLFPRLPEHSYCATPEAVAGAVSPQTPALQSRYRCERSPRPMERCGLQTAHRRASLSSWPLGCVVHILQEKETFARKRVHLLLSKTEKKKKKIPGKLPQSWIFPAIFLFRHFFPFSSVKFVPQKPESH